MSNTHTPPHKTIIQCIKKKKRIYLTFRIVFVLTTFFPSNVTKNRRKNDKQDINKITSIEEVNRDCPLVDRKSFKFRQSCSTRRERQVIANNPCAFGSRNFSWMRVTSMWESFCYVANVRGRELFILNTFNLYVDDVEIVLRYSAQRNGGTSLKFALRTILFQDLKSYGCRHTPPLRVRGFVFAGLIVHGRITGTIVCDH